MSSQFVNCDECGTEIPWNSAHVHQEVTEDGKSKNGKKERFCYDCCPRCQKPASELPVKEDGTI